MIGRRGWIGIALSVVVLGCDAAPKPNETAAGASPSPAPPTTPPATSVPSATPVPATSCVESGTSSTLVAYSDAADLWVYDDATSERRAVTDDGDARVEWAPEFVASTCLAFTSTEPASIEIVELGDQGARRRIVEEAGWIIDFTISPDATSVFYLHIDHEVDATSRLKRVGIDGGTPEIVYTFDPNPGRGAGSEDEVSIAFSPDGSMLLIANTHASSEDFPNGSIFQFDGTGLTLIDRWTGTHPRWSPDGGTIYFRGYAGLNGQRWSVLDVQSRDLTSLAMTAGTNGLAVSPDGRRLAYDTTYFGDYPNEAETSGEAPSVYLFDLETGRETILQDAAMGPLWISHGAVLVMNVREPGPDSMNSWEALGTVSRITVGGVRSSVDMLSTLFDAAVLIGA